MKVIKPTPITDAMLISSNALEDDYAVYMSATNYAVGARCIYTHQIWESVQTPNAGHTPGTNALFWAVIGPTNRHAMFDNEISTQTAMTDILTVVIKPGYANSLALFALEGSGLAVTVRDGLGGPIMYSKELSLDGTVIADWYQYFFEPSVQLAEVVLTDLPPYGNAYITVSISGIGTVKCGDMSVGTMYMLGDTQFGASAGIVDYSRKDTSATGVTALSKRSYSKRMTAQMMLDTAQINKVQRVLASLRATPCAWIGTDIAGYEPLIVFGFYRDFSIDIAYSAVSYCNLEIEGLT
jgi:hypothetical protein